MDNLNNDNSDKWKNKYLDLLDENENLEKSYLDNEDLLCKTIVRLSLATTGFNKDLDPHLLRIRNTLKKGLKSSVLRSELESFSSALISLEDHKQELAIPNPALLFDFLYQHFPEQKNNLQLIESNFKKNKFSNSEYLLAAINDSIDSSLLPKQSTPNLDGFAENTLDTNAINSQLLQLLEQVEIPFELEDPAKKLREQLHSNSTISNVLDETVALLFKIKKHAQSEHQEMANYLAQLTEQLTSLGIKASGATSSADLVAKKRNKLDQSVSSQMLDLQNSSKSATKLEPLKQLINSRLVDITQQIQKHHSDEVSERNQIHQELESLTLKIHEMEQESCQLNDKLTAAQQRSLHDPLTGLANRLAYDQRLATELARSKRYKVPLSILIWDIDLFKHINDNFGHKAGDKTLVLISRLLSQHCRETDFVSRFGGEEFTMLLSDTDGQSALLAAEKLRKIVEKAAFHSNGKKISITISCGITQFTEDDTDESAFNRADEALYKAKNNGRNQCIIS